MLQQKAKQIQRPGAWQRQWQRRKEREREGAEGKNSRPLNSGSSIHFHSFSFARSFPVAASSWYGCLRFPAPIHFTMMFCYFAFCLSDENHIVLRCDTHFYYKYPVTMWMLSMRWAKKWERERESDKWNMLYWHNQRWKMYFGHVQKCWRVRTHTFCTYDFFLFIRWYLILCVFKGFPYVWEARVLCLNKIILAKTTCTTYEKPIRLHINFTLNYINAVVVFSCCFCWSLFIFHNILSRDKRCFP